MLPSGTIQFNSEYHASIAAVTASTVGDNQYLKSTHDHTETRFVTPTLNEIVESLPIFILISRCTTSEEVADQIKNCANTAGLRMSKPSIKKKENTFYITIRGENSFSRLSEAAAKMITATAK